MTATDTSATLKLVNGQDGDEQEWVLSGKSTFRMGRVQDNEICLPFSWVSRKHAMIQVEENGSHNLIDLGSSNGTFVNGKRVYTPTILQNGDCIGIGNTRIMFHQAQANINPEPLPAADLDEMTVAFVQKEIVTILICDIHDFTRVSEIMGDQRLSQLLQYWTGKVSKIVRKHDGIVDKFIGDAVMALWAGGDLQSNIHQALKTAINISVFTRNLADKVEDIPWPLEIGAALNTGEAMLGNLGQNGQANYTVVGDVVNVAFRLEDQTSKKRGLDLLMGKDAASHLVNLEEFFNPQSFELKGKQGPVEAYGCSFKELWNYIKKYSPETPQ